HFREDPCRFAAIQIAARTRHLLQQQRPQGPRSWRQLAPIVMEKQRQYSFLAPFCAANGDRPQRPVTPDLERDAGYHDGWNRLAWHKTRHPRRNSPNSWFFQRQMDCGGLPLGVTECEYCGWRGRSIGPPQLPACLSFL